MRLGDITIRCVNDGTFKLDGGQMFGVVPRVLWEKATPPDAQNRITLAVNSFLVETAGYRVLLDVGLGTKYSERQRENYGMAAGRLLAGLKRLGVRPEEIDAVTLTHLHFDHAGGSTHLDDSGKAVLTFPNARYFVQRRSWEEAMSENERTRRNYARQDFEPLAEAGKLVLLDGRADVAPGVWVEPTEGHSTGHQAVHIESGGRRAVLLGDVLPTVHHLPLPWLTGFDVRPLESLEVKRVVLAQAERDGWLILFIHGSPNAMGGHLERRDGRLVLRPVEL